MSVNTAARPLPGRLAAALALLAAAPAGAQQWPSFRGPQASGVAAGAAPVATSWNVPTGTAVLWKTPIPGISVSSPIVWGDRLFVSTAVSSDPNAGFRHGLYGDVEPAKDVGPHVWRLIALDRKTGKVLWDKVAHEGVPKTKRHPKSSQASPTPVTDGTHVVVSFGSEGLYAYTCQGRPAVEAGPRRAQRRLVLRSRLRVGRRQLADHLEEPGDRAVRHPAELVRGGVRRQDRQAGVADQPRRDPVVVDADGDRDGRPHRAGHAGHERDPRLRPGHRQGAVAPVRQLRGHRADADRRPGHGHRHQRVSRRAADLRDQAGRPRRSHARRRRHQLGRPSPGARSAAARTCRRRSSTAICSTSC